MTNLDPAISQLTAAYSAAVKAKDAAAFMRLYEPKARVFDAWGVWSHEGAAAWQRAVEGWFASLGTERVIVTFGGLQSSQAGDFALVSSFVSYTGLSAQGETLRAMHNRQSWGLRMKGHQLRIVHEHSSVPIGFEDMKAILLRQP